MGYLYKSSCYAALEEAKAALCADAHTITATSGGVMSAACVSTDFTLPVYSLRLTDGLTSSSQSIPYPQFPSCDSSSPIEFVTDFWGVALALSVAVVCSKVILNIFRGRQDVV